ncbi:hypothetical protein AGMMS50268_22650 [Spirochaetia bacterium]|nr:hypothetical protein AGMMS50268_22650 [Spirochaetia bacterium]
MSATVTPGTPTGLQSSGGSLLDKLVNELPLEERNSLLEKLRAQSNMSPEPLYEVHEETAAVAGIVEQYAKLPWYYRLYYFILSFFKGKTPLKIFEDARIGKVGREIDAGYPGLYDYQPGNLQGEFYQLLWGLKESARFFFDALDVSVSRDRGAFYAFLGSLEMGDVHDRLQKETDPKNIVKKSPGASESEIRQTALRAMEDAFGAINEDQRNTMYSNARSLYCLKELSSFLFDRVLMAFGPSAPPGKQAPGAGSEAPQICSVYVVRDMLNSLNNILFSLRNPPPLTLLESLFIFILQEKSAAPDFNINTEIQLLLNRAEKAMITIRNFNRKIPLTLILRCGSRDMSLSPKIVSGGEDWFAVYREYWKRQIEEQLAVYQIFRRRQGMLDSFQDFLKGTELRMLSNTVSETNPEGFPLPGAFALAFLRTFHSAVFMTDMNRFLKPITEKGEFFKQENRIEFIESYSDMAKIEDDIRAIEARIAPSGEYGKRYTMTKQDMSSLAVKRRKVQMVADDAATDAFGIISRSRGAANTIINILKAILKQESGGRYDSLSNLSDFTEKDPGFSAEATDMIRKFQRVLQLLDEIDKMESGRN